MKDQILDQSITLDNMTVRDLYNFCKERDALDYPINFTVSIYDSDTDNYYDLGVVDLGIPIYVNVDNVNNVVDLFPERRD